MLNQYAKDGDERDGDDRNDEMKHGGLWLDRLVGGLTVSSGLLSHEYPRCWRIRQVYPTTLLSRRGTQNATTRAHPPEPSPP